MLESPFTKDYTDFMKLDYESERLYLKIQNGEITSEVLDFFQKNKLFFEKTEPPHSEQFYEPEFMEQLLNSEFKLALKLASIRFWLYEKENPKQIVGTISFTHILGLPYSSCNVGYRLDQAHTGLGYATEAMETAIDVIHKELHLHRMQAMIMPENERSIRLAERLGFTYEGLMRRVIRIGDHWEDHYLYSKIFPQES